MLHNIILKFHLRHFSFQTNIVLGQLKEIVIALENYKLDFLCMIRDDDAVFGEFAKKVKDRGIIVRKLVEQMEILGHGSVKWFISHYGGNLVMKSVVARGPMLGWLMTTEQHLNAKFVVEEMNIVKD